ncbi:hypothetical protein N7E81_17130 [Reichenbachiella carrageenanivorans]|uniref:Hydroxyacid dehydrogenase n=1 Tax=Reichenbachiella carrageenanivorans TaxID=2979869 RepID=A0ABY6D0C2_9BACT|nr:four-carbon acid sugar kinase family protein [Reichenbachiella carrageenanivorans]UXX79080.1 hypothetical protein N7E81_17130 [Reichenbachiella carrageenanivorans]
MGQILDHIIDFPPEDCTVTGEQIDALRGDQVVVVLDDDPTGTQSVHDVFILTEWSKEDLRWAFSHEVFYILTNSRSLDAAHAFALVSQICENVKSVAHELGKSFLVVTRGDSTLRGHFQAETSAVKQAVGQPDALTVFAPVFFEGHRVTVNNGHYIREGQQLIPVSETPFAQDMTFGYASSNLYEYVEEKSLYAPEEIFDLSISEIRQQTIEELAQKIFDYKSKKVLIINALVLADLSKAVAGILRAQQKGVQLMIRSGASMVSTLAGIRPKALLGEQDFSVGQVGGVIVVGSYVPKTTAQLNFLTQNHPLEQIEIDVNQLLINESEIVAQAAVKLNKAVSEGRDCVMYTSRALVSGEDGDASLSIVNQVSNGVISILNSLEETPAFVIAKGGITSSEVATKVLGIKRAKVLGQILPGIPVWELGSETKFPQIPFIVFPGNVGEEESLGEAYKKLKPTNA